MRNCRIAFWESGEAIVGEVRDTDNTSAPGVQWCEGKGLARSGWPGRGARAGLRLF